jgi:hypothetical protein
MPETPDCLVCAASPAELACTLHGGHMTATEVEMRHTHMIEGDRWVKRRSAPDPFAPTFQALIDRVFEVMQKAGIKI